MNVAFTMHFVQYCTSEIRSTAWIWLNGASPKASATTGVQSSPSRFSMPNPAIALSMIFPLALEYVLGHAVAQTHEGGTFIAKQPSSTASLEHRRDAVAIAVVEWGEDPGNVPSLP